MSYEWVELDGLGSVGMQPDVSALSRDPKAFDYAVNVRSIGHDVANAGGYETLYNWPTSPAIFNTIFPYEPDDAWEPADEWPILICGRNETLAEQVLYKYENATITAVSVPTPIAYDSFYRWSGGWLQKSLIISDNRVARRFVPGATTTTEVKWDGTDSWEDNGYRALVWRPFREFMLAANTYIDGVRQGSQVRWSDAVEPGGAPDDWVPTDENRAGFVVLADTPGRIVDMVQLRDKMVIYKEDSIYFCEWVGGNSVFRFRKVTDFIGLSARDAVVEVNGVHYIQGDDDILVFDGNTVKSLLFGRMKNYFRTDKTDKLRFQRNSFTYYDKLHNEIVFAYCDTSATSADHYPSRAVVLSLDTGSLWMRDWGDERVGHAVCAPGGLRTYAVFPYEYDLRDLENADDRDGVEVDAQLVRTGLFYAPGHDWVQVNQIKVPFVGSTNSTDLITNTVCRVKLGQQSAPDTTVTWRTQITIDPADYKIDARVNGNLIAYQIDVETGGPWHLPSLAAYVQKSGERK